ncbi:S8 family serine peptidase [Microbacterium sp. SL62]|uniref:S8 family serine peptidase n=1 Tax=Microbacterium sp. SL62 TaxID=2995139 RepID=UPI0022764020|nr:S8 family serine peptidase [Microbacterium sp. SL62]MCY1715850.1 S8 family serine peptidase [Microbacterium sp. SL62]
MADHLPLPPPLTLDGAKRREGFPDGGGDLSRRGQATTLRGILEGLESHSPGLFSLSTDDDVEDDGIDADDLGRHVFKITGKMPFSTSGLGGWEHKFVQLAFAHDRAFFALSDADSRAILRTLIEGYNEDPEDFTTSSKAWLDALDNITGIELYGREDRTAPDLRFPEVDDVTTVDVSIWPTSVASRGALKVAKERLDEVEALITSDTDGRVRVLLSDASNPDRIHLRAQVDRATLDALLNHPLVERVRGPLAIDVRAEDLSAAPRPTDSITPAGAPIGVIDDLVSTANPWMHNVVRATRDFPSSGALGTPTTHGTHVAAIAAWGRVADLLGGTVDRDPRPIYAARVAHSNAQGQAELADEPTLQVESAMRWLASENVRIVVFAYAQAYADSGALPADLSAVIDMLARELDMVVIVSAGNLTALPSGTHWKTDYPQYLEDENARIAAPGTAALALTVGSIAHTDQVDVSRFPGGVGIAPAGKGAPFSRTGPTGTGQQKPEFGGYGGSWAWNHDTDALLINDANVSAISLTPASGGRLFSTVAGTSYAAPHVANEVAKIATRYPAAGANLLRALTALSAEPPHHMPNVQHAAYGVPRAENVLESEGSRAILVHEGIIDGNTYQVIELPVPEQFASGAWERELRVALAFDPAVRRSRREYISCHIDVDFVRNISLDEIKEIWRRQPTRADRLRGAAFRDLPTGRERPGLLPGVQSVNSDTVFCRRYRTVGNAWSVDDETYYLVLSHTYSPWTEAQKKEYPTQDYALAVEFLAVGQPHLDLHSLTQAQLNARVRGRARS